MNKISVNINNEKISHFVIKTNYGKWKTNVLYHMSSVYNLCAYMIKI